MRYIKKHLKGTLRIVPCTLCLVVHKQHECNRAVILQNYCDMLLLRQLHVPISLRNSQIKY